MIRSTKTSTKFANIGKQIELESFLSEYQKVMQRFVDMFWGLSKVPFLPPKQFTEKIDSWLSARMIQCAGKQASGIVRGTRKKHEQRLWRLKQLEKEKKSTKHLKQIVKDHPVSKPILYNISAELDERFVKISLDSLTSFDGWVTISSIGQGKKLIIPFKRHDHFNQLMDKGTIKKGIRIKAKTITFIFEIEKKPKTDGKTIGLDIGINSVCSTSNGILSQTNNHGHDLNSILRKIVRRKKGSKGFRQATDHRKNFVNWSINRLDLRNVKEIRREEIKNLRQNKRVSRFLSHWTYADIFEKLDRFCEDQGVLVTKTNPAYTSRTCSRCGTLGKRRGQHFRCLNPSCGYTDNADLNASRNLSGEPIVPHENSFL